MTDTCAVFFQAGACDLECAGQALAKTGLAVSKGDGFLRVGRPGAPTYRVRLSTEPHVQVEAAEIAAGTPHESAMRACAARFEIEIDDLDEALDEINTLMEVQGGLQEASNGYLFIPWSGSLSAPWNPGQ